MLIAIAVFTLTAQSAFACFPEMFTFHYAATQTQLVVLGTITSVSTDVAILETEILFKGTLLSSTLRINNHHIGSGTDCDESLVEGDRFVVGTRILAFLEQDRFSIGADWIPAGLGGSWVWMVTPEGKMKQDSWSSILGSPNSLLEAQAILLTITSPTSLSSQTPLLDATGQTPHPEQRLSIIGFALAMLLSGVAFRRYSPYTLRA